MADQPLPHDIELEQSIIASLLLHAETGGSIFDKLSTGDFYNVKHQSIFKAAFGLLLDEKPFDVVPIVHRLQETGELEKAGGASYLHELMDVPVPSSVGHYCSLLLELSARRAMITSANELIKLASDRSKDISSIHETINSLASRIDKKRPKTSSFKLLHVGGIDITPPDHLVDKILERNILAQVFGDPGCGKSFIAVDFACCIATGIDFHGFRTKQKPVVYIAGEGQSGIGRRFMAWSIRNGIDIHDAPLWVSVQPACLLDGENVRAIIKAIDALDDKPALIVIDTLARNFGPGDENSTSDMTRFIAECDRLRVAYNATILLIHHSGHGDKSRARGAMALKGALDAEYRLEKDSHGVVRFEATKMKDGQMPDAMAFEIRSVDLSLESDEGERVTSALLERIDYMPPEKTTSLGKGRNQLSALEHLEKLRVERGDDKVPIHEWRDACCQCMDRRAFYRVKKALSSQGKIIEDMMYVSVQP